MRIGDISANSRVEIEFTNPMKFPSTYDFIMLNKDFELLNIRMLSGSEEGSFSTNLGSWEVYSVSSTLVIIKL